MIFWLTTAPNPRSAATGHDAGQRGWKLHAIEAPENAQLKDVRYTGSTCGLHPWHGWGLDLFITDKCSRCLARLKV